MRLSFIILVILLAYPLSGCYSQNQKAVRLAAAKEDNSNTWDFGQVLAGQTLTHEFIFKNDSSKDLNIKDVSTTCGCTVSEVKKKFLKPQESTIIKIKFDSKGYNGEVKQFIYINTDNLDNPITRLIIRAHVKK